MYQLGEYNNLSINREVDFGVYLVDDKGVEILLPKNQVPKGARVGDVLKVFIYADSEDRPIGTMIHPKAIVGDIVGLKVVDVNSLGAFLDWGLMKDLLLPFKNQSRANPLEVGDTVLVKVLFDPVSERLVATTRLTVTYIPEKGKLESRDCVKIQITALHELGFVVLINNKFRGMLYSSETFEDLSIGDVRDAYIKQIREDNKIDVTLKQAGVKAVFGDKELILEKLKSSSDGSLPLNSKTDPNEIQEVFHISKKAFKKAIGGLYKERKIVITDSGIKLK